MIIRFPVKPLRGTVDKRAMLWREAGLVYPMLDGQRWRQAHTFQDIDLMLGVRRRLGLKE